MKIEKTFLINNDSAELYIQTYDVSNRFRYHVEGESLVYSAYFPFFNNKKAMNKVRNMEDCYRHEWVKSKDKSITNKLIFGQWITIAIIILPILIPVIACLYVAEKIQKIKKYVRV